MQLCLVNNAGGDIFDRVFLGGAFDKGGSRGDSFNKATYKVGRLRWAALTEGGSRRTVLTGILRRQLPQTERYATWEHNNKADISTDNRYIHKTKFCLSMQVLKGDRFAFEKTHG